jgi:hypothetical protein
MEYQSSLIRALDYAESIDSHADAQDHSVLGDRAGLLGGITMPETRMAARWNREPARSN